ncbi:MAG: anthranilate synthase component I [Proteobacteria bacterium]|nr:anthranilate synthase component I [Pseudomonadota bacterium]
MNLEPGFESFAAVHAGGQSQVVWTRLIDDLETPVSAFLKLAADRPYACLLESVEGGAFRGRYSILTLEPDLVWRCRGRRAEISRGADLESGRFQPEPECALQSLKRLERESRIALPAGLPPMAAGLFGAVGYDMAGLVERLPEPKADPLDLPDAVLTRPGVVAIFDALKQEIVLVAPVRPAGETAQAAWAGAEARILAVRDALATGSVPRREGQPLPVVFESNTSRPAFIAVVERAKRYIEAGDAFQVVPSQRFSAPLAWPSHAFYRALRRLNPSPYLFHLDLGGFQLAGSSPEILVRLRDGRVAIRPLAGTRRRGATPEEDVALEHELLADPKERAEHLMLVDLGRNDVGRFAKPGSVRVTQSFSVERYSHVMHIVSHVEGEALEQVDPIDLLLGALPAGTLSGAPKIRAMEIIHELEPAKRGLAYAGAAGWISCEGQVDMCILLRTALIKDGLMHVQAGAGVVADSDPQAEFEETLHKSNALRRAAEEAWRFA